MDSDKIIILDHGNVAEMGKPSDLLEKEGGALRSMVDSHGEAYSQTLRQIARGELRVEEVELDESSDGDENGS